MTTEPIESHAVHSRRMLDHAAEMIAQGDRLRASEKIWAAAAHRLKEIAVEREWPNDSHADGWAIIHHIRRQTGDRRISDLFSIASDAHQNFYEDRFSLEILADKLDAITELLSLLDDAHQTLPPDLPRPDDRHYRNRQR